MNEEETRNHTHSYTPPGRPVAVYPPQTPPRERPPGGAWKVVKVLLVLLLATGLLGSLMLNLILLGALGGGLAGGGRVEEATLAEPGSPDARQRVAIIEVVGLIDAGNLEGWSRMLAKARRDQRVQAVVIRVNSPGGAINAADQLHRLIAKTRRSGKTVVVSMGAIATSGAYYISMPANEILAEPTTITGSIGVMMPHINVAGFLQKHGIKDETFVAHGSNKKYAISWTREVTPEGRRMVQSILDDAYERFVAVVAEGRPKLTPSQVRTLADGSIYSANQAKARGLVDRIGYLEDAVSRAAALAKLARFRTVRYRYRRPLSLRNLLGIRSPHTPLDLRNRLLLLAGSSPALYLWPGCWQAALLTAEYPPT